MTDLANSLYIASSGMAAQSERLKIIAQNIANADNVGQKPDDTPYRRKIISFKNVMDKQLGVPRVQVSKIGVDSSEFRTKYDPTHPAANAEGYIFLPNVNSMIENGDLKEAERTYAANVNVVEVTKSMLQNTLGLIK